jgi:Rrf2 family protein
MEIFPLIFSKWDGIFFAFLPDGFGPKPPISRDNIYMEEVMHINHNVRYAVSCLLTLSKNSDAYVGCVDLAKHQHVPLAFCQKILQQLSHVGLITSKKGMGYKLNKSLSDITLFDVIDALSNVDEEKPPDDLTQHIQEKVRSALEACPLVEFAQ